MILPLRCMVHFDDTFLNDVSGYAPWCGWFTSNQSTSAIAPPGSAEDLTSFTVISGPPDLSLTVSPACICALSVMLHSSVLAGGKATGAARWSKPELLRSALFAGLAM